MILSSRESPILTGKITTFRGRLKGISSVLLFVVAPDLHDAMDTDTIVRANNIDDMRRVTIVEHDSRRDAKSQQK